MPNFDKHQGYTSKESGFTLIEVMLVILIAGILTTMVSLSLGGSETRKLLQEREELIDSIAIIRLEAQDQGRMLGLVPFYQTATDPPRYAVVQFDPNESNKDKRWKLAEDFKIHDLPPGSELNITLSQDNAPRNQNTALEKFKVDSALNPQLIWFGNGEATAARLQILQDAKPVGDAIEVTALGRVNNDSSGSNSSIHGDQ
ncbi:pilus assembly FimT family protein [Aquirhabdus parva]|uniref:Type II secretion system protein GspH n=1 Tax=Aquirhabdus parva TaxID=2283318 RepID=A0A345P679_9GAMM|nr:prepilin-type N-terminal cleavage/methylation domain-containing protein [Aquirhabdus parva]AXI02788.1 type II secretion system protein GspH [Aquirhabdus parva]